MADKQSRLVFSAPPSGGSAIDTYRVMVFEGQALIETVTGQSPLLVTHAASAERTAVLQAHNAQGWSTPIEVTIPATTPASGGGGGGGDTDLPPGEGEPSGAVPTGEYLAPSGFTATALDGGILFDVTDRGRGYTTAFINYTSAFDGQTQGQGFAEQYLWPIVILGITNEYAVSATLKVEDVELETSSVTPSATGTPHAPQFELAYDAGQGTLTALQTVAASGPYDELLIGYAKSGDTEATYLRNATLPVTFPATPGDYSVASYILIKNKVVNYFFATYTVPASGGATAG